MDQALHPTPWNSDLATRLGLLKPGTHRVAYFSELPDQASFRYRCYNMAQALNIYSSTYSGSYFFLSDLQAIRNLAEYADTLVLSRVRYDGDVHRLIDQFKAAGKPVISDLDDLIFHPQYAGLVARSLDHPTHGKVIDSWFAFLSRVGETLRLSDRVIVSTPHLAGLVAQEVSIPVSTVSNFLNEEQLVASAAAREDKKERRRGRIRLGYFSGSASHSLDFAIVAPALRELLTTRDDVELVLAGHVEPPEILSSLHSSLTLLPYMDILSLQGAMASVDLNVVALQDNDFTFCKSELKFFEAAIVETPTIATATPVFDAAIEHGRSGFLVSDHDWSGALTSALAELEGSSGRIGKVARDVAKARFSPEAMCPSIEAAIGIK